MVRATVGGRPVDLTRQQIEDRMQGIGPEPIREHVVAMLNTVYPPKQVLATVTGWERTTFTTMEAQRVLKRAGFRCGRAGKLPDGRVALVPLSDDEEDRPGVARDATPSVEERLTRTEAALAVANQAIASLVGRVAQLEHQCNLGLQPA